MAKPRIQGDNSTHTPGTKFIQLRHSRVRKIAAAVKASIKRPHRTALLDAMASLVKPASYGETASSSPAAALVRLATVRPVLR